MPKIAPIRPSQIQGYFETASLDAAELLLDIVTAKVRSRKQKSQDAKAAQGGGGKKKGAKGPQAAPPAAQESAAPHAGEVQ